VRELAGYHSWDHGGGDAGKSDVGDDGGGKGWTTLGGRRRTTDGGVGVVRPDAAGGDRDERWDVGEGESGGGRERRWECGGWVDDAERDDWEKSRGGVEEVAVEDG
tara:strand:+ start:235 stop:552 length:318 start_codon:yes stop_codon:yes gene_type:complete